MGLVFFFWLLGKGGSLLLGASGPLARAERPGKGWKLGEVAEPVVHFKEWTTSWGGKAEKGPETWGSGRASGPLLRVDH